jgi:hypothetical protein
MLAWLTELMLKSGILSGDAFNPTEVLAGLTP